MGFNSAFKVLKKKKSVLWKVAKCLSYIEEARCLKVKGKVPSVIFGAEMN